MRTCTSLYTTFSLLLFVIPCDAAAHKPRGSTDLVRSSCTHASYPALCLRTLSTYPGPPAHTLTELAQLAVKVSLSRSHNAYVYMGQLERCRHRGSRKREGVALRDCLDQLSDAASELGDTVRELRRLKTGSFQWRMSNAQTWASAALTCQTTCLDGIREATGDGDHGGSLMIKEDVRRRIRNLTKVTSNALYLINLLDQSTRGKGKP